MTAPTLSLCMIVRNEEAALPRCLSSARHVVDEMIVVDTGSTDHTAALAETFGARVERFEWCDDFSAARNASLGYASGDWIFYLDADEELVDPGRLRELVAEPGVDAWLLRVEHLHERGMFHSDECRLFRRGFAFEGYVHASVAVPPGATCRVLPEVLIRHHGFHRDVITGRNKQERSARLAAREAARAPDDPVARLRAGKAFLAAGQPRAALEQLEAGLRLSAGPGLNEAESFLWAAIAAQALEDHERAVRIGGDGIGTYPDYLDLHYVQGMSLQTLDRLPEAGRHLAMALLLCALPGPYPSSGGADPERIQEALLDVARRAPPRPTPVWPVVQDVDFAFPRVPNPWLPGGSPPWRTSYPPFALGWPPGAE